MTVQDNERGTNESSALWLGRRGLTVFCWGVYVCAGLGLARRGGLIDKLNSVRSVHRLNEHRT